MNAIKNGQVILNANPDQKGHEWVKERYTPTKEELDAADLRITISEHRNGDSRRCKR